MLSGQIRLPGTHLIAWHIVRLGIQGTVYTGSSTAHVQHTRMHAVVFTTFSCYSTESFLGQYLTLTLSLQHFKYADPIEYSLQNAYVNTQCNKYSALRFNRVITVPYITRIMVYRVKWISDDPV